MNIGKAIRQSREEKGINQKTLAGMLVISQNSLSQIEMGKKRPNPKTLKKICIELKISEAMLYILSVEEKDVPIDRKEMFNLLFPDIKSLALKLF